MSSRFTDDERRRRLARRHLLLPDRRATAVTEIADSLVALHSSDPTTVHLSAALRLREPSIRTVERALYHDRLVVRHHAMRRTIWVMTPGVAAAAHAGFTRKIARSEIGRAAKLFGKSEEWFVDAVDRVAAVVESAGGPIGTREVGAAVPDLAEPITVHQGRNHEGRMAAHTRALLQAAIEGRITRARPTGTWIGSQYRWVASDAWHDIDWDAYGVEAGATDVVRRWLERFGPGTLDDLVWWTGGTKTLVRQALAEITPDEVRLDDGATGFGLPGDHGDTEPIDPWVALLPGLDPTPMGWKQRDWYLPRAIAERVIDRNGNVGPTVWADGVVVGGWVQRPDGSIAHDAGGLSAEHGRLLAVEIDRLRALVGATRFRVRFPAPNQTDLLGG
jgi:hypothetical protein